MAILCDYQPAHRRRPGAAAGWAGAGWRALLGLVLGLLAVAAHAQRPQLRLDLLAASSPAFDQAYVYMQAGASTGFDANFDAEKLANPNGLNLASQLPTGQQFAIKGLPPSVLATSFTLGLFVGIPQDDVYTLQVGQLDNFGLASVYLADAELQTRQLLALGTTYTFPLNGANTGGTGITTRFSLVFEPANPLPVTLTAFTAQRQGPAGLVQWATAAEQHNAYFEVESSPDGRTFTALGRVAGAGTSAQAHQYQWVDADLARYAAPQVYYRLRQVDTDGTSTFSPVRALAVPAPDLALAAFPNPVLVCQVLRLRIQAPTAGPAQLRIIDALGHLVGQRALDLPAGASTTALPEAGQWAAGLYRVQVQLGARQQATTVVRP